ncbi:MAG TPA: alpha/beta hydrolase [Verrucomicrobiae bacterium]|nr:alpha/beta hydrolase [Verrucomicrobiae bacterium]
MAVSSREGAPGTGKSLFKGSATGLLLPVVLRWFEHSQVYHPSRLMEATGAELGRPFEDVWFRAKDGVELNGWFFPGDTHSARGGLALLFCHGNAGNISHRLDAVRGLLSTGVSVFLFDYRGYGRSRGRPSEEGTYSDAEAAYRWLESKGFAGKKIVLFGESLGGGVAAELATRLPVAGLVLQSTFTCIPDIGAELFPWLPVRFLARINYDTHSKLPRIKVPVLIMHSRADRLVRFQHSQRNFAAANSPKLFCELAGDHNDSISDPSRYLGDLKKFLQVIESSAK